MPNDDLHSFSFNLPCSIGSTTRIPIIFPEDYKFWALYFEYYVMGIQTHGTSIWQAMTVVTYKYSGSREEVKTQVDYDAIIAENIEIPNDEKAKQQFNLKAM